MTLASSVAAPKSTAPLRARRSSADPPTVRGRASIRCASEPTTDDRGRSRRDALLSLASLGAVPALTPARSASANVASIYKYEPVDALPPAIADSGNAKVPIAAALRAQTVYAGYAVPIIEKNVTAPLGTLISLAARDAGTFDAAADTGGLNGSIRFELDRPENRRFLNAVEQLADIRRGLDPCAGAADDSPSASSAPSINGTPAPQLVPCFCGAEPALVRKLRAAGCIARGDRVEADARAARRWCEDELLKAPLS